MDALFQIGKEIGEIRGRIEKLEQQEECHCKSRRGGELKESELTNHQRRVLLFLRRNHKKIFELLNQVLASESLALESAVGERLYIRSFRLMSSEQHEKLSDAYGDMCCICCPDGNYCCDFNSCLYCAHDCAR